MSTLLSSTTTEAAFLADFRKYFLDPETGLVFTVIDRQTLLPATDALFADAEVDFTDRLDGFTPAECWMHENCGMTTGAWLAYCALRGNRDEGSRAVDAIWRVYQAGKTVAPGYFPKYYGRRCSPETSTDQVLYACVGMDAFHPLASASDRAKIEAEINEHTRAIMCTNPGNPTGVVLTPEEQRMMCDIAKEHGLFIIGDEAYREFVYAGEPLQSFGEYTDAAENVIVIDTVSKRFSACGARVGCILTRNHDLLAEAMKFCQARLSVATLDQIASAALYQVGPEYFAAVRDEYKRRRDTVVNKLKEIPGVICEEPKGAFYIMAALPVDDADKFQQWLLEEFEDNGDTVMFAPGEPFYGTPGKGKNEIRIAYVLKQADLERAMDLLALGIKAYNEKK